ncbi:MAG: hypothetical protein NVS2B6_01060 [Thermoleophilaceae bacterium]
MTQQVAQVMVYTLSGCLHCARARRLLKRRGIAYAETSGDADPEFRHFLFERTGQMTVPQILIEGEPIGSADALAALDRLGVLLPRIYGHRFPLATVHRRWKVRRLPRSAAAPWLGKAGGPWQHLVELRDRDGRLVDCREVPSSRRAQELARSLNQERLPDSRTS